MNRTNSDPVVKSFYIPLANAGRSRSESGNCFKNFFLKTASPLTSPRKKSPRFKQLLPSQPLIEEFIQFRYGDWQYSFPSERVIKKAPGLVSEMAKGEIISLDNLGSTAANLALAFLGNADFDWKPLPENDIFICITKLGSEMLLKHYLLDVGLKHKNLNMVLNCLSKMPISWMVKECSEFIQKYADDLDIKTLENLFKISVKLKSLSDQFCILRAIQIKRGIDAISNQTLNQMYAEFKSYLGYIECQIGAISINGEYMKGWKLLDRIRRLVFKQESNVKIWVTLTESSSLKYINRLIEEIKNPDCIVTHIHICSNTQNTDDKIIQLIEALEDNPSVAFLRLNGNIGSKTCFALKSLLMKRRLIIDLDLSYTHVGDVGIRLLGDTCQNPIFEHLNISHCNLTSKCLKSFHRFNMSHLDLCENDLGVKGAKGAAKILKNTKALTYFDLSKNKIESKGAAYIFNALEANHSLKSLILNQNDILDDISQGLGKFLSSNRSIKRLYLCNNRLNNNCARSIAKGLVKNKILQYLNLSGNPMGRRGKLLLENSKKHIIM